MVELAYTADSKSAAARLAGSSPAPGIGITQGIKMRPVDKQAALLYDAQWEAFCGSPLNEPLASSECVGMNNLLYTRARDKGYWHTPYIPPLRFVAEGTLGWIPQGPIAGMAWHWTNQVEPCYVQLAPEGKRGWVIAHEAAHLILLAGRPAHAHYEAHGKEYAAVFIWAVSALFGIKWSNRLKRAFAEARVEAVCSLQED